MTARGYLVEPDQAQIIVLLSHGKSGTGTIGNLLRLSDDLAVPKNNLFPRFWHLDNEVWRGPENKDWEWAYKVAREEVISASNIIGKIFCEVDHHVSIWAPHIKRVFPNTRFVLGWRDIDWVVRSGYQWDWYGPRDKLINYRIQPPELLTRTQRIAWSWVALYNFLIDFLTDIDKHSVFYLPFTAIANKDVEHIKRMFEWIGVQPPKEKKLLEILQRKQNESSGEAPELKDWGTYEVQARKIIDRIEELRVQ